MEYNNDIEKLLQQYGRQQQLASHVRHLAHVQARRRTWVACTLLVLLGSIGIVRMLSTSQTLEQSLVAQQMQPAADNTASAVNAGAVNAEVKQETTPTKLYDNHIALKENHDSFLQSIVEEPPLVATLPREDTAVLQDRQEIIRPDHHDTLSPAVLVADISPADIQALPKQSSRFHFISSVTASVTPFYGSGNVDDFSNSHANNSSAFSPRCTFTADVGASVTIAGNNQRHFDIGLTLGGHYQQGELLNVGYGQMSGVDGLQTEVVTMQPEGTYNTFSLYASLPLTFSIAPQDNKSVGWSLSLTPAHSITEIRMLRGLELNPWRLTLGVGILFPKKFPRRVSLIANLLPLYTSQRIHEIGIEVGF